MMRKKENFCHSSVHRQDLSLGSSNIYIEGNQITKVLKSSATLYQFCKDYPPEKVLILLNKVKTLMESAFGDLLVPTEYFIEADKIVTTQPIIKGKTLREIGRFHDDQFPNTEVINLGIERLRNNWQEDQDLLGYIIDEILDPNNIIFDAKTLMIIDWI